MWSLIFDLCRKAELDVTLSDDTFMQMAAGKIKPDQASNLYLYILQKKIFSLVATDNSWTDLIIVSTKSVLFHYSVWSLKEYGWKVKHNGIK